MRSWLFVMQDNAPAHTEANTTENMSQRLIQLIFWPANSPDLNPIEAVWKRMKDYIQRHYSNLGGGNEHTQDRLCNKGSMGFRVSRRSCETHSEYASKMSGCDRCSWGTNLISRPENIPATCSDQRLG
ncbi:Bgt-50199 [Blumeria graminis f. sp. tritici]|uniref:Bgt-50199 n=1 Tax=Blumeria graminis f. sp. tritici TaxID=62690 RepID=A0A9X9MER8_BLUGR|nr:Bgt-50199 [Blumeria graminis f. sp. tritici]